MVDDCMVVGLVANVDETEGVVEFVRAKRPSVRWMRPPEEMGTL